jgi:hypothetical protein
VPVYFRSYDVDDPSENQTIDQNGNSGNDNRGTFSDSGAPITPGPSHANGNNGRLRPVNGTWANEAYIVVMTNGEGIAEVDLATTFAPGDNFRVAATTDVNAIERLDTVSTNDVVTGFEGKVSDQLAIWRRFHIERARMVQTVSVDKQSGSAPQQSTAPATGQVIVTVDFNIGTENRYAGGLLRLGNKNYAIDENTAGNMVTVRSNVVLPAGPVTLYEDDFATPVGTPDAEPVARVNTEDDVVMYDFMNTTTLRSQNRFADAYIVPVRDTLDQFRSFVASTPHVSETNDLLSLYGQSAGTNAPGSRTNLFWVVYLTSAYEPVASNDFDPEQSENAELGASVGQTADANYASFVFYETIRDYAPSSFPGSIALAATAIHEVGHQFGLSRTENGHRDDIQNIMMSNPLSNATNNTFYFHPEDIADLREQYEGPGML